MTLRVLQTSCGALVVASLLALGEAASAIPVDGTAANVVSMRPAVPMEWVRAGPLAMPTIGVVPQASRTGTTQARRGR